VPVTYARGVPKLWSATIEDHRKEVRVAILETTAELVSQRGALSVTMTEIAQATGIGRATLYKYFSDVESILLAWHERLIGGHLAHLASLADGDGPAIDRLTAVLEGYAAIARQRAGSQLAALLHRDEHVIRAEAGLVELLARLAGEAALEGTVRDDVDPNEIGSFCMHALNAAGHSRSKAAVHRIVELALAALRP
jgi:AcrR family transcriptional regulator